MGVTFHAAYAEWGVRMARIVRRELYGEAVDGNIDAPNVLSARWTGQRQITLRIWRHRRRAASGARCSGIFFSLRRHGGGRRAGGGYERRADDSHAESGGDPVVY